MIVGDETTCLLVYHGHHKQQRLLKIASQHHKGQHKMPAHVSFDIFFRHISGTLLDPLDWLRDKVVGLLYSSAWCEPTSKEHSYMSLSTGSLLLSRLFVVKIILA